MPEVVLYGGKGGVGKTTCAAATGLAAARNGAETLVVSTDPAHSLGDIFETRLGGDPTRVTEGLSAVETDPAGGTDQYEALFEALIADLEGVGVDLDEAGLRDLFESGLLPGSDELAALSNLDAYASDDRWDRVVFDTAPTGHTLRLLDLPDAIGTGVRTAQSLHEQVSRKARAAKTMLFGPYAATTDDEGQSFADVLAEMERVRDVLRDPDRTEFRVVCLPERLVVAETERLIERLREAGVPVGNLLVNRVLTDIDEGCTRCRSQRESQRAVLETIRETFPNLDIIELPDTTGKQGDATTLEALADRIETA